MRTEQFILAILFCGVTALQVANTRNKLLRCSADSTLEDIQTEGDLYDRLYPKILDPGDDIERINIKRRFMQYLVHSRAFLDIIGCTSSSQAGAVEQRLPRQEDEDGDDGDDGGTPTGGGLGGLGGRPQGPNVNVINGVSKILANVLTGNLIGVIQEGVQLRGPQRISPVFTDVLATLFGSAATQGFTVQMNATTVSPVMENATLSYEAQQFLVQHFLAQQGQLNAGPEQGVNAPVENQELQEQKFPPTQYPSGQYTPSGVQQPQQQLQQFHLPQQGGIGNRRPLQPQGQFPQQAVKPFPRPQQTQQFPGGLNRLQQLQLQNPQFSGELQTPSNVRPGGLNQRQKLPPQQNLFGGGLPVSGGGGGGAPIQNQNHIRPQHLGIPQRHNEGQGNRRRRTTPPPAPEYYEDNDE